MAFHVAHSTTIILLEYYCSDGTYTKLEQRGHLTQVAFIYYLFSEFLFQRVGQSPLSAEGVSHFSVSANLSHPLAPQAVSVRGSVKAGFTHFPLEIPGFPILSTDLVVN